VILERSQRPLVEGVGADLDGVFDPFRVRMANHAGLHSRNSIIFAFYSPASFLPRLPSTARHPYAIPSNRPELC
jgi:hypothetical protein